MVLSKVMPFLRMADLALVYFDKVILTYIPKFRNTKMAYNPHVVIHVKKGRP